MSTSGYSSAVKKKDNTEKSQVILSCFALLNEMSKRSSVVRTSVIDTLRPCRLARRRTDASSEPFASIAMTFCAGQLAKWATTTDRPHKEDLGLRLEFVVKTTLAAAAAI